MKKPIACLMSLLLAASLGTGSLVAYADEVPGNALPEENVSTGDGTSEDTSSDDSEGDSEDVVDSTTGSDSVPGPTIESTAEDAAPDAPEKVVAKTETKTNGIAEAPVIKVRAHMQNHGWMGWQNLGVGSSVTVGIAGKSLRMESLAIAVQKPGSLKQQTVTTYTDGTTETKDAPNKALNGSIEYNAHVQNIGWQRKVTANSSGSAAIGTTGRYLRVEAVNLKLTGELAKTFDIYYRVHAQNLGWLEWAKNGENAGTANCSLRLEAIEIRLVEKGKAAPSPTAKHYLVSATLPSSAHVQNIGWQGKRAGAVGTTGRSLRMEAVRIDAPSGIDVSGGVQYRVHVQNVGWQNWVSNGATAGTEGKSLRLEAIAVQLTGDLAKYYDVYYSTHIQNYGWLGWAKNGQIAGSEGRSLRMEALQVCIVPKGLSAPGPTSGYYVNGFTGDAGVDAWLNNQARSLGSLWSCYNWVKGHRHTNWAGVGIKRYNNGTTYWYAGEIARMRDGRPADCYSFSATFAGLAHALGYDAKAVCGYVPSLSRGWAAHSWVEIRQGGCTLVYDPDLGNNYPRVNFYAFTYSNSPTSYRF